MALGATSCGSDQAPKIATHLDTMSVCVGGPTVNPSTATLHLGDTLRLRASLGCLPPTATGVRWTSSNDSIAVVDSAGLVRAMSRGAVTIILSAVVDPNIKGAAAITVVP